MVLLEKKIMIPVKKISMLTAVTIVFLIWLERCLKVAKSFEHKRAI